MISVNYLGFDTAVNMNKEFNEIVLILDDGQEECPTSPHNDANPYLPIFQPPNPAKSNEPVIKKTGNIAIIYPTIDCNGDVKQELNGNQGAEADKIEVALSSVFLPAYATMVLYTEENLEGNVPNMLQN